jgi:anthranilate synthase/aminodeoxychorismate synthase-like glutamine amidotransferase
MVLLIDNYDSFTYNLNDYILQCGETCRIVRNDELTLKEIETLDFSSAIISPGPKTPEDAGITLTFIDKYVEKIPILGVCLGHQAIGEFFGASLVKAIRPMHGKTSEVITGEHPIFEGLPSSFKVMRYHSLVLQNIPTNELQVIAETAEGEVMAIAHLKLPIVGVQFHPESILTEHGYQLMKNWLAFAHKSTF